MKVKVIVLVVVPIVVLWGVGMFIYFRLGDTSAKINSMADVYLKAFEYSKNIHIESLKGEESVFSYVISKSDSNKERALQSMENLKSIVKQFDSLPLTKYANDLKTMKSYISSLESQVQELDKEIKSGSQDLTSEENKLRKTMSDIVTLASNMAESSKKDIDTSADVARNSISTAMFLQLYIPLIVLAISIVIALLVVRAMFVNMKPLMEAANKLQNNDLSFEFQEGREKKGKDELSQLFEAFRKATMALKENMKNLHQNSKEVSNEMDNVT